MNFSDVINNYIDKLECSSKEICKASNLAPALISRYLNNKRTPKIDSKYFNQLVDGIYKLSIEKNLNISKKSIYDNLKNSILESTIDYNTFVDNFNTIQNELKISTVEIAKSLGYDVSFLSRIKNKERKPANIEDFIDELQKIIYSSIKFPNKKEILLNLFECEEDLLNDYTKFSEIFKNWIIIKHENYNSDLINFLNILDTFTLNDYIGTDFNKVKIITTPVIFKNSKTFYGIEGRKHAESEFLKTTLISKSKEPIFFYSNLPISNAGKDEEFKKKWILAITMILKKGLHLNIIHNVDRPLDEMLLGLESWLPIYMTGSISPYYFLNPPSNLFIGSHCTSGSVALSSECLNFNEKNSKFYLTTKKDEVEFEKQKSKYLLSKAKPLMKIFKETNLNEFEEFINLPENKNIKKIKNNTFKNIDFDINKNKWIMINKKTSPEIHFVIYNDKLRKAIETFLNI